MRAFTAAIIAGLAYASDWPSVDVSKFVESTFENMIDHFNYLDDRTYHQRYWFSDEYWDGSGPIFIYICGEYRCSVPDTRLFPFMVGAAHKARFMVVEHRFYGESQPLPTWELDSFRYLNSEQAMADLAYFIGEMNPEQKNEVLVIGGSYPGALSAWFRSRYPHLTAGSWSSSGVVQPIVDFWKFDEQTYLSSVKSGDFCPKMIQDSMTYVTQQGKARDGGDGDTIIDQTIVGTVSEGMRTDDWMFYYADIFLESVQYGHRTALCDKLNTIKTATQDQIVTMMNSWGAQIGVTPPDYDTRVIANTKVDTESSARPWTFQYCSEYGWFQIPSEEHIMRSTYLQSDFWYSMCARSFGTGMPYNPKAEQTTIDQGGVDIAATNIFFANGSEDPWKWASQMEGNSTLNQVARVSDCDNCGHCVELYTPADSDPEELKKTRTMISDWVDSLLSSSKEQQKPQEFLQ